MTAGLARVSGLGSRVSGLGSRGDDWSQAVALLTRWVHARHLPSPDDLVQEALLRLWSLERRWGPLEVREPLLEKQLRWALGDLIRREKRWRARHPERLQDEDVRLAVAADPVASAPAHASLDLPNLLRGRQLRVAEAVQDGAMGVSVIAARAGVRTDKVRPALQAIVELLARESDPEWGGGNAEGGNGSPSPGG